MHGGLAGRARDQLGAELAALAGVILEVVRLVEDQARAGNCKQAVDVSFRRS